MNDALDKTKNFLKNWHQLVDQRDATLLPQLIAEDAQLLSPAFWRPREGREKVATVLAAVSSIFKDIRYTKQWVDGNEIILEFEAKVVDKNLKGIDRIKLNQDGKLQEIEVLIRPMNALMLLAQELGKKLGPDAL